MQSNYLQLRSVDACPDTSSPGPMMVYALTLNVTIVLGGRSLNTYCLTVVLTIVVDELHEHSSLTLNRSSYAMTTPLGSEGELHKRVSCVTAVVADSLDTGPGTTIIITKHVTVYHATMSTHVHATVF